MIETATIYSVFAAAEAELKRADQKQPDIVVLERLSRPIAEALKSHPFFEGDKVVSTGWGARGLLLVLPRMLLRRIQTQGAGASAQWLERILQVKEARVLVVMPVRGVKVTSTVDLGSGLTLRPVSELPGSPQWDDLRRSSESELNPALWPLPETALTMRLVVSPLYAEREKFSAPDMSSLAELLEDARFCLSLVGPRGTLAPAFWCQFEDVELAGFAEFCGSLLTRLNEIQPIVLKEHGPFDPVQAADLVSRFQRIKEAKDKSRIRRALNRFDRSTRRHDSGDAAVELGIALDSLLGDGNTELTYRIGLRAALLAGGSMAERLERRAIVTAIYSLRSTTVHEGGSPSEVKVGKGFGRMSPAELVRRGTIATAQVIGAAIRRGGLPDWFEEEVGHTRPGSPVGEKSET